MSVCLDAGEAHVEVCYMDDDVMFRVRGGKDLGALPMAEIVERLRTERDTRALTP